MDYRTLDKLRTIIDDPSAAPAERAYAQAQLNKAATALVVTDGKSLGWRERVKERTLTVIAEERDKRVAIAERAEERARASVAAQHQHEIRIEKGRIDHAVYVVKAQNDLEEAQCVLEEQRALRAERLARAKIRAN